jgi:hypothetical protein
MIRRTMLATPLFAGLVSLALAMGAQAQEGQPVPPGGMNVAEAKKTMTDEQILAFVKGLDPNAKLAPLDKGSQIRFNYTHKHLTIPFVVNLNDGYAWFACPVGQMPNADTIAPELLVKMLRSHFPVGPTFFRIGKAGKVDVIELGHRIDRPTSTERLGMAIREMAGDVETTEPIWKELIKKEPVK